MSQFKGDQKFTRVPENATVQQLNARVNLLMGQLQSLQTNIERTSQGSQTILVVGGTVSSSTGGTLTVGAYGAKSVVLTAGTHTVSFGKTFTVPFIYFVSAMGTIEGRPVLITPGIVSVTTSDMTVTVDMDCTFFHHEVAET